MIENNTMPRDQLLFQNLTQTDQQTLNEFTRQHQTLSDSESQSISASESSDNNDENDSDEMEEMKKNSCSRRVDNISLLVEQMKRKRIDNLNNRPNDVGVTFDSF